MDYTQLVINFLEIIGGSAILALLTVLIQYFTEESCLYRKGRFFRSLLVPVLYFVIAIPAIEWALKKASFGIFEMAATVALCVWFSGSFMKALLESR